MEFLGGYDLGDGHIRPHIGERCRAVGYNSPWIWGTTIRTYRLDCPSNPDHIVQLSSPKRTDRCYAVRTVRALVITGYDWPTILPGVLVLGVFASIEVTLAMLAFRKVGE